MGIDPKRSLQYLSPKIAAQWHPTKNGSLTPTAVANKSNKKYWWQCSKSNEHVWQAVVASRTDENSRGCPFCAGRKVCYENSLAINYPEIAAHWHPTKNGRLTPDEVTFGTHKKVWWQCEKVSAHTWNAEIVSRTAGGRGCPFCSGNRK